MKYSNCLSMLGGESFPPVKVDMDVGVSGVLYLCMY